MPSAFFMMIGKGDAPIFEMEYTTDPSREDRSQLKHFVLHAALDNLDNVMWTNSSFYHKNIDRYNEFSVSAYVTPGYVRLLMMQDREPTENLRYFFHEVYELYVKVLMNPFYETGARITSPTFATRVQTLLKRHLQ